MLEAVRAALISADRGVGIRKIISQLRKFCCSALRQLPRAGTVPQGGLKLQLSRAYNVSRTPNGPALPGTGHKVLPRRGATLIHRALAGQHVSAEVWFEQIAEDLLCTAQKKLTFIVQCTINAKPTD